MFQKINVKAWLIRIKGVTRLEHNPAVDASELWNRTATPETLAKLAGMALKLASVPDCPYHKQHTLCRYETGDVPNCRGRGMKEQNKAIDEKALTELRKLVVEREKLDGRIKELLGINTETRPTKKPLSREQFRMLCGV